MYYELPAGAQVPYVWEDLTADVKKMKLTVDGGSRVYNLDKVKIYKDLEGESGARYQV